MSVRFRLLIVLGVLALPVSAVPAEDASVVRVKVNPGIVLRRDLPRGLFGFNIHQVHFQRFLWTPQGVDSRVLPALKQLEGALYRYPGGLLANRFSWEDSVGSHRVPQRLVRWSDPVTASFGVAEYVEFVRSVGGQLWYVLNLAGWDRDGLYHELPSKQVAESNARLARLVKASRSPSDSPVYYELGNELDRANYEWSHEKYISRSAATIAAIKKVDPEARFVAFVRDFDWTYKRADRGRTVSRSQDFIRDVMRGLPEVHDIALHAYYDDPGMEQRKTKQIPWRLRHFQTAINSAKRERTSGEVNVWITEHARGINMSLPKPGRRAPLTSNLQAAVSTADFLISVARIPEVSGAALHSLNASPWESFDATIDYNDLRPRPTVEALLVLAKMDLPVVLLSNATGPNASEYGGGYDVSVTSFSNAQNSRLGFWSVNRANTARIVRYQVPGWQDRMVSVRHITIAGEEGAAPDVRTPKRRLELDPKPYGGKFDSKGNIEIELGPMSVSTIIIDVR